MCIRVTALVLGLALAGGAGSAVGQSCPLYVLERSGGSFVIREDTVPDGEASVYMWPGDFVSLILPWSAGQSGDVVQEAQGRGATAARCERGTLTVTVQQPGKEPRVLPPLEAASVRRYRMRVSVHPGSGSPVAFIVHPDGSIARDTLAPPTDMFRGSVPLQPGDVSITTEIREADVGARAVGSVELRRAGPYFLATLQVVGGGEGEVIVDLGASRTLLSRDMLPPGVEPKALTAVEHGPEGERVMAGSMGAFGGEVADIGAAPLAGVRVGSVAISDVWVNVIPELPELAGVQVKGILGADLLQHAAVTRLTALPGGGRLDFAAEVRGEPPLLEVPFSLVGGLIIVTGTVNGRSMPFILDTGARGSIVAESTVRALGLEPIPGAGDTFRGLDGAPVETWAAIIPSLRLGNGSLDSFRVNAGSFAVLDRMGLPGGGLLGQDLWERFGALEVDWKGAVVRWFPIAEPPDLVPAESFAPQARLGV